MPLQFQLYMQVNPGSVHDYLYVGVSRETNRIISICGEHIWITEREDNLFDEADYVLTSRYFSFDLSKLDDLVEAYTGYREYKIMTYFSEEKHSVLTYHSATNECAKDYDIFCGYPDKRAEQLAENIYPFMQAAKNAAFLVD